MHSPLVMERSTVQSCLAAPEPQPPHARTPCSKHRASSPVISESTLTCPMCRHQATETMPTDACQFFYECKSCGERLKPLAGDCCVFCSYGSVPCPPVQENGKATCCS